MSGTPSLSPRAALAAVAALGVLAVPATASADDAPAAPLTEEEHRNFDRNPYEWNADLFPKPGGEDRSEGALVPEPGTIALLGFGLATLAAARRTRRSS